jgi:zinc/manganese transport system permease protein
VSLPFDDPLFLTALAGALALACGAAPLGVLLIGRRMSLVGDSLSHATLPGAAIAYVLAGPDPWLLTFGALIAGVVVAVSSTLLSRYGRMPEDAAFAVLYLSALAIGIVILGRTASAEVVHGLLFGNVKALDGPGLTLAAAAAGSTLIALVLGSRTLESAADENPRDVTAWTGLAQALLMGLVAVNLVAGFRAFGALMTVGLMMVPAAAARYWSVRFRGRMIAAVLVSAASSAAGLVGAQVFRLEPGPAMVLAAALLFILSLVQGSVRSGLQNARQ